MAELGGRMEREAAARTVWEADRTIARLCARSYVQQVFPGAVPLWGGDGEPTEPDELDAVWRVPDDDGARLLVVTALAGEYTLPRRQFPGGTTVSPAPATTCGTPPTASASTGGAISPGRSNRTCTPTGCGTSS
ncbi:hypothetical protein AAH979_06205 [Plantactinospora sp. ZYX-F-223]|uniref:hypothetical protein n=1 Tax=Plantactinospora sp. ZYX-F-223 TaxID=3144103 RepID=UPI0031FD201C